MHGGDWASYKEKYGREPLDFSANINPLGVPESVKAAIREAVETADRYPDPQCRELCRAIGEYEQIPEEYILCGNGAADLIWRLAAACSPGKLLLPVPAFTEYRAAFEAGGWEIRPFFLHEEDDFRLTEAFLPALQETFHKDLPPVSFCGMVLLCEPGNPAGVTTDPALLRQILEICHESGVLLVVDECFLELTDDPARHTLKSMLKDTPNLIILRAFTKTCAMAGIRLGYCMSSNRKLLQRMWNSGQPWAVSHLAQAAGIAALGDNAYREKTREWICKERPYLQAGLEGLGFRVVPGEANYLLFRSTVPLMEPLRKEGILLRDCRDYEGLGEGWYRTAIRTREENRKLLNVVDTVKKSAGTEIGNYLTKELRGAGK